VRLGNQADADARAAHEAERQAERKARTKRNAIKRKRSKPRPALPPEVYAAKVEGRTCRICTSTNVEAHHLVERKHFPHDDVTQNHPDNIAPYCVEHHAGHTSRMHPLPWSSLNESERRFVLHHKGERWAGKNYA